MRIHRLVLLGLFLAIGGCGGDNDTSPEPESPPPPVDAQDFLSAYANAACSRFERCFLTAPYWVEQCKSDMIAQLGESPADAVAAGRMEYNADEAGKCIAGVENLDCLADTVSDATLAACFAAMKGKVAEGQPCFAVFECEHGACPAIAEDACPTVCPAVAQAGDTCSLIAGPYCDARAGLKCSGGSCITPGGLDASCKDNYGCKSGFVCWSATNKCIPLRGEGEGCATDASCAPGLYCIAEGDEGGICEPRIKEGGPCSTNAEENNAAFRFVQCADGLLCKGAGLQNDGTPIAGTCQRPSSEGEACLAEPAGLQLHLSGCLDGLYCPAGTCESLPDTGACAPHSACLHGVSYCDQATSMCTPLGANGDTCTIDPECASGYCIGGKCLESVTFCGP